MSSRVGLIAGREFRAYAATTSFWIALSMGPLLTGGALLISSHAVSQSTGAAASLTLSQEKPGGSVSATFDAGFPLSAAGRARVLEVIARDGTLHGPIRPAASETKPAFDKPFLSRFALLILLWTALTGSLGMLLQAVVRERSNRALESLLAAARPADIVFGKLLGVGGVSLLVMSTWLGGSAALGAAQRGPANVVSDLFKSFLDPTVMGRAAGIYILAYAFFGLTTVALGAMARDTAGAQNLARPMFTLLLAGFFTSLMAANGAHGLTWLVYVPPFTPFMLLMQPQPMATELIALATLAAATVLAAWLAVSVLRLSPPSLRGAFSRRRARAAPAPVAR